MTNVKTFCKLLHRFEKIAEGLYRHREFTLHRHIDHAYYLQRVEEMKILLEQFLEAEKKFGLLQLRLHDHHAVSFAHWKADIRWLSDYQRRFEHSRTIVGDLV